MAEQILIGTLAASLGLLSLFAAATCWQPAYRLRSVRFIQQQLGHVAARLFFAAMALVLLALAAAILLGVRPAYAVSSQPLDRSPLDRFPRLAHR